LIRALPTICPQSARGRQEETFLETEMVDKSLDDIISETRKTGKGGGGKGKGRAGRTRGGGGGAVGEAPGSPWAKKTAGLPGDISFWLHDDRAGDGPSQDDELLFSTSKGSKGAGKSGGKGRRTGSSPYGWEADDAHFGAFRRSASKLGGEPSYGKWRHDLFDGGLGFGEPYRAAGGWGKKGGGGKSKGKGKSVGKRSSGLPEKCPW